MGCLLKLPCLLCPCDSDTNLNAYCPPMLYALCSPSAYPSTGVSSHFRFSTNLLILPSFVIWLSVYSFDCSLRCVSLANSFSRVLICIFYTCVFCVILLVGRSYAFELCCYEERQLRLGLWSVSQMGLRRVKNERKGAMENLCCS
mgnify:CR=1 FL=1